MQLSAWLMMIFGCLVLYGGLAICLMTAIKHCPSDVTEKKEIS
jgi:hypothetical protein